MGENKRTHPDKRRGMIERADRAARVTGLYLRGLTIEQITARTGISRSTVSRDLRLFEQKQLARAEKNREKIRAKRIAELDEVKVESWNSFERSKADAEKTVTKITPVLDDDGNLIEPMDGDVQTFEESIITIQGQAGDPRLLQQVQTSIMNQARLEGLTGNEFSGGTSFNANTANVQLILPDNGRGDRPVMEKK